MEENKCYNKVVKYNLFDVGEQVSTVFDDKLKEKKRKEKKDRDGERVLMLLWR